MKKTLKWSFMMMLAVIGLTFTSCSDDDDNTPKVPTVEDVNGEYTGKMTFAKVEKETAADPTATELDLVVKNDSISFEKFPFEVLVEEILGKEGAADIIKEIGTLKYKVGYKATMNAANDSIYMTLDPKPLKITIEKLNMVVDVTIEAADKGSFAVKDNNLKFNLTATEAMVGEMNFLKDPIKLSFDMKKK